ncbi:MAG TPA: class D beta-lactamase [Lentimicrobium sp.]|jgi:beta-lactamase class D|nr:class D beta-lactamase [Lentimicrobium sp.]
MKKLFLFCFSLFCLNVYSQNTSGKRIEMPDFKSLLDSFQLSGSILVFDKDNNTYYSNDFMWAEEGHLPASTFKIPNSIIALETGVISSDSSILKWDGKPRRLKAWEQDLTLRDAFKVSCVPCYQEIARKIGVKRMREYLDKLQYPGMVFDTSSIDRFWLEGDSKISQMQQIEFLYRFYFSKLPVSGRTQQIVKSIMLSEKTDQYRLSGKTGWGIRDGKDNAWYVGFLETNNKVYFFATNVIPKEGFNMDNFTTARMEVSKSALKRMGLM